MLLIITDTQKFFYSHFSKLATKLSRNFYLLLK